MEGVAGGGRAGWLLAWGVLEIPTQHQPGCDSPRMHAPTCSPRHQAAGGCTIGSLSTRQPGGPEGCSRIHFGLMVFTPPSKGRLPEGRSSHMWYHHVMLPYAPGSTIAAQSGPVSNRQRSRRELGPRAAGPG
jgi:hypothetical protein